MSLLFLVALALGSPPDKTARLYVVSTSSAATNEIGSMQVSGDGKLVVGRTDADQGGFVLDVDTWEVLPVAPCAVAGIGVDAVEYAGGDVVHTIWTLCTDGRFVPLEYYQGTLYDYVDSSGASLEFPLTLDTSEEPVGLWVVPGTGQVVGATRSDAQLAAYSLPGDWGETSTADLLGSLLLATTDIVSAEYAPTADSIVFSHGSRINPSLLPVGTGFWNQPTGNGNPPDCVDLFGAPSFGIYCVGQGNQVGTLSPVNLTFTGFTGVGVFDDPLAVIVNETPGDAWIAVTGGQVKVWRMSDVGTITTPEAPYFVGDAANNNQIRDGVTSEGVLFGGGVAGNLHVVTAKPWMKNTGDASFVDQAEGAAATTGDLVGITFEWDEDVSWSAYLGGDRNQRGRLLTSGSAAADTSVSFEVEVTADWDEGENGIFVFGGSTEAPEDVGHGYLPVQVDNPPKPPVLRASGVQFGDGSLTLSFDGIRDADLDHYTIYVSDAPFEASDFPDGGGPTLSATRPRTPIVVSAAPGTAVSYSIAPLVNDQTYYMAVRATDTGGKEGGMSNVVSGTPEQTFSAAQLAGEAGGSPCSTSGMAAAGSLVLLALAGLWRRSGAVAALGAAFLLSGANAWAADDEDKWWKADMTPSRGDFEIRYGVIDLADPVLKDFYDQKDTNLLQMEFGPQFWRFVEVDGGLGFFQELATTRSASGLSSNEVAMLTWYQLGLDGTLRAHFLDEQPLVPFVRYGWDYVIFTDQAKFASGTTKVKGGRFGSHYSLGVNLLLDLFQPGRASMLEARSGINDSWLTFEWRRQTIDWRDRPWSGASSGRDGFVFSGDVIQLGLKLDY